jgi:hypothetical protein
MGDGHDQGRKVEKGAIQPRSRVSVNPIQNFL